jgi:hypothetical protein
MKLHSPAFETTLKRGVHEIVRTDAAVRAEYCRAKKGFRRRPFAFIVRPIVSILPAAIIVQIIATTHHLETGLFAANFWLLLFLLLQVQQLIRLPTHSRDIAALRLLPVSDETIFDWEFDKYAKGSCFLLVDMAMCLGALGWTQHLSPWQWLMTLLLVPLVWMFGTTLCMLGAARFPHLPYGQAVGIIYVVGMVAVFGHKLMGNGLLGFLDRHAPVLNYLFPTGWPLSLFHFVVGDRPAIFALVVVPLAAVLATWADSRRILRARCAYHEHVVPQVEDTIPGEEAEAASDETAPAMPRKLGVTAMEEGILRGAFLALEVWRGGWMERALWRWLSVRERHLAEFAFPRPPQLTRAWYQIARNFLIALLLVIGATRLSSALAAALCGFGLLIVLGQVLAMTLGTGVTFRAVPNGGVNIPFYAPFPMGIGELTGLYLKCFLVQWPCVVLLALAIAVPLAGMIGQDLERGLLEGLRAGILFGGVRLYALGFAFLTGAADSRRFRPRTWLMLIVSAVFGFVVLAFGAIALLPASNAVVWTCMAVAMGAAALYFFLCRVFYHHLRLDLMTMSR